MRFRLHPFSSSEDFGEDAWSSVIHAYELIGFVESAERSRRRLVHYRNIFEADS